MNPKETLQEARALVEAGWCQHSYAKNAADVQVEIVSPDACKFCMRGALLKASSSKRDQFLEIEFFHAALVKVLSVIGADTVTFNDREGRTKEQVLEMFDRAIASC